MRRAVLLVLGLSAFALVASCKESASPVLTKCQSDAECVYTTENRGGCCVNPCGNPSKAVHQEEAQAITRYNTDYCTEAVRKQCPVAGACGQPPAAPPANPPKCNGGMCVNG